MMSGPRFICHTDASVRPDGRQLGMYFGVKLTDQVTGISTEYASKLPRNLSNSGLFNNVNDAELIAIFEGMHLAALYGVRQVRFVHDSAAANMALRGKTSMRRLETAYLRQQILQFAAEYSIQAEFTHVSREKNKAADKLASKTKQPFLTRIPPAYLEGYAAQMPVLDFIRQNLGFMVERVYPGRPIPAALHGKPVALDRGHIIAEENATGDQLMLAAGLLVMAGDKAKEITIEQANIQYRETGATYGEAAIIWAKQTCDKIGLSRAWLVPKSAHIQPISPAPSPVPVFMPVPTPVAPIHPY